MEMTSAGVDATSLCGDCGRCWMCEFAGIFRVDPVRCPGCGHRETCLEHLYDEFGELD